MSAGDYMFLPPTEALRWFKVLAVFRLAASQGRSAGFELPPDRMPLRVGESDRRAVILMADDQELLREAMGEFLAMQGHEVRTAACGADAMRMMEEGLRPDLLVSDILLPDIHGIGLAREARMLFPELQVLFISGHPPETFEDEIGADEFLQKPFRLDVLARKVRSLLEIRYVQ